MCETSYLKFICQTHFISHARQVCSQWAVTLSFFSYKIIWSMFVHKPNQTLHLSEPQMPDLFVTQPNSGRERPVYSRVCDTSQALWWIPNSAGQTDDRTGNVDTRRSSEKSRVEDKRDVGRREQGWSAKMLVELVRGALESLPGKNSSM